MSQPYQLDRDVGCQLGGDGQARHQLSTTVGVSVGADPIGPIGFAKRLIAVLVWASTDQPTSGAPLGA
jgi:hypothetical protein